MSIANLLKQRTSVRAYLDAPISEATVRGLLDAAGWAPSGGNLQPWKVLVVTGDAREAVSRVASQRMKENPEGEADERPIYPPNLVEPYRSRRHKVGEDMFALLGIPREDKPARRQWVARNFEFFGAPVGLFFVIDRSMGHGQWAHLGMFMQSLALVSVDSGLACCMQEAWALVRKTLHAHFGLPDSEMIYCGMALGYADPRAPVNDLRTERAPVEEFATFYGF